MLAELNGKRTVASLEKVSVKNVGNNPPRYIDGTNIALNLPALFLGNKGSGKTFMMRKVMQLLSDSSQVAKIYVLQKGELADEAMDAEALADMPKVETLPLSQFDSTVKGMIEARDLVKAIGEALKKIIKFKQTHHTWRRLAIGMASVRDFGISDPKILKILDAHEELSNVGQQIRFLTEFAQ
jgi:Cdc6-like AAA superfamily ATPase